MVASADPGAIRAITEPYAWIYWAVNGAPPHTPSGTSQAKRAAGERADHEPAAKQRHVELKAMPTR